MKRPDLPPLSEADRAFYEHEAQETARRFHERERKRAEMARQREQAQAGRNGGNRGVRGTDAPNGGHTPPDEQPDARHAESQDARGWQAGPPEGYDAPPEAGPWSQRAPSDRGVWGTDAPNGAPPDRGVWGTDAPNSGQTTPLLGREPDARCSEREEARRSECGIPAAELAEGDAVTTCTALDLDALLAPISWHWERWLAPGFVHILAGDSGVGKSSLALHIAAAYINGQNWPDGSAFTQLPGKALWLEAESAQALNLHRLKRWGVPLDRLLLLRVPNQDPVLDVDVTNPAHRCAIITAAGRADVGVVILDSFSAARAGRDENDASSLEAMRWLAQLARDTHKPVLVTHHLRKRGMLDSGEGVTLERLRGSSTIVQVARLVWALEKWDEDGSLRLSVIKSNLDKFPTPLGVTIGEEGLGFGELAEKEEEDTSALGEAKRFLLEVLKDGPRAARDVQQEADEAGIAKTGLFRARKAMGVDTRREGRNWLWFIPQREENETIEI